MDTYLDSRSESLADSRSERDERLDAALAALPRERAGDGFTAAVLERVDAESPARRSSHRRAPTILALAAVVLLAVGLGLAEWRERVAVRAAADRVAAIEIEARLLAQELRELHEKARQAQPVVYLGGTEDVDIVLDLARLVGARPATQTANTPTADARLAAWTPPDTDRAY